MQIIIQNQSEYDALVKNNKYLYNELVIKNNIGNPIKVKTDVTVAENGVCETSGDQELRITVVENGSITAKGKAEVLGYDNAKITVSGNCTVRAYDKSVVEAHGNSVVTAKQQAKVYGGDFTRIRGEDSSEITGVNNCTIWAQNSCMASAYHNCKVQATDDCLIITDDFASVKVQENCVVITKKFNSNITLYGQSKRINMDQITEFNIIGKLENLSKTKAFKERPYAALQFMMIKIPNDRIKEGINERLAMKGCKDKESTEKYLNALIKEDTHVNKKEKKRKENLCVER